MSQPTATAWIHPRRTIAPVNPMIYGGFIEHLGRCIYGGIYEEGSPLTDARGFRTDVLAAIRELDMPILRWPGGNFVSGYHWRDGVGPKDRRPARRDLAWKTVESNRFGTHEFIDCCRELGAEPYICLNLGSGAPEEAADWAEYCNSTADTELADLRRRHGAEEPFGVTYWGLGNELYGSWQIGQKSAAQYARVARETAKLLRWLDPSIRTVACGCNDPHGVAWNLEVLREAGHLFDYLAIHTYLGAPDPAENVLQPFFLEREIVNAAGLIRQVAFERGWPKRPKIAFDEYNYWYRKRSDNRLEERYTLADAVGLAGCLAALVRHADVVEIANLAQVVNVIAPIFTRPDGLFRQTIYFPFQLFSRHLRGVALDVRCQSPAAEVCERPRYPGRETLRFDVPLVDVVATWQPERRSLRIAAINRDVSDAISLEIRLTEVQPTAARAYRVHADSPDAVNDFDAEPVAIREVDIPLDAGASRLTVPLPPCSLTVIVAE